MEPVPTTQAVENSQSKQAKRQREEEDAVPAQGELDCKLARLDGQALLMYFLMVEQGAGNSELRPPVQQVQRFPEELKERLRILYRNYKIQHRYDADSDAEIVQQEGREARF